MSGITVTAKTPFANGGDAFKVDPDDVLGIAYSRYKTTVYALALSKPALYYDGRAIIVDQIKEAAIKGIYNTIYDFLKSGKCGGTRVEDALKTPNLQPCYPSAKINELAIGAAESLDEIIEKCIAVVLPANYDDIAQKKITQQGQANL